ncbi:MAG: TolC family protein [Campylobacteraceae bacterium]|nr:TolC family protein [Campylobacteraceae bacterium]
MKVFSFILLSSLSLQASTSLDLQALLELALKNNPSVQIQKYIKEEQYANITSTKAAYLPTLSANADLSSYDIKQASSAVKDKSVKTYSLIAKQLIYDFGKTSYSIKASKSNYNASKEKVLSIVSKVSFDVKKAYFSILKNYELIKVAQQSVDIDAQQLYRIQEYVNAGIKSKIDISNAKLSLSTSKLDLIKANFALKQAYNSLISLLGTKEKYLIKEEKRDIKDLSKKIAPPLQDLEYYLAQGLKNRYELKMYEYLIQGNKDALSSSNAEFFPKVNIQASYNNTLSHEQFLDKEQNIVGVYLSWDLFTGFSSKAKVLKNKSALNQNKEKRVQEELKIQENISAAYISLLENYESTKLSLESLALAKDNLYLSQERYKNGLNDIYELNTSKVQFTKALSSLVDIYYSYEISIANLEYASSILYNKGQK